jgi:hypothetical protein
LSRRLSCRGSVGGNWSARRGVLRSCFIERNTWRIRTSRGGILGDVPRVILGGGSGHWCRQRGRRRGRFRWGGRSPARRGARSRRRVLVASGTGSVLKNKKSKEMIGRPQKYLLRVPNLVGYLGSPKYVPLSQVSNRSDVCVIKTLVQRIDLNVVRNKYV